MCLAQILGQSEHFYDVESQRPKVMFALSQTQILHHSEQTMWRGHNRGVGMGI